MRASSRPPTFARDAAPAWAGGRAMTAFVGQVLCASVLFGAAAVGVAQPARAADPNVPCPTDTDAGGQALLSAVRFANDNPDTTIELAAGCTYTLRQSSAEPFLPVAASMTIRGNGARVLRPADTEHFYMFEVQAGVTLNMSNLILSSATDLHGHLREALVISAGAFASLSQLRLDAGGPGIRNDGTLTVADSDFVGINARNTAGGAIRNTSNGTLVVQRTTFTGNRVNGPTGELQTGGAIFNGGQAFIGESTFTQNSGSVGGAITNAGSLDVRDSTFDRNSADLDGGALRQSGGSSLFLRTTFTGNRAVRSGGAIQASGGNMVINASTLSDNRAVRPQFANLVAQGGAIHSTITMSMENNTFAANVAEQGTAIYHDDSTHGITMSGTVLDGAGQLCGGVTGKIFDAGHNLQSSASAGCPGTFAVGDPRLGSLADHGGLTDTILPRAGSPLLDAIPLDACPVRDQRNFPRPAGPKCDIGAVEDQLPTAPGTVTLATGNSPNRGDFGLQWTPSTDPEGPVTYRLYRQDHDDSTSTLVGMSGSPSYTFTSGAPEQEGTSRYWAEAVDSAGASQRSATASDAIVSDRSGPTGLIASADRTADYAGSGIGDEWYADTVTVSFSGATDPALADGSAGSGIASTTAPATYTTSGAHTATGTATDVAGNLSQATSLPVQVDADNPTVSFTSCPSTVLLHAVTSAGWSANDASSGLQSARSGSVALDTATVGPHHVQSPAPRDNVGHDGTVASCAYDVIYDFVGFLGLSAYPAATVIKARDGVTVRFTLAGDQGLGVLAAGSPTALPVDCATGAVLGAATPAASKRGLTYSKATGTYSQQWTTDPAWAKTCRQLVVELNDGTVHRANFSFK